MEETTLYLKGTYEQIYEVDVARDEIFAPILELKIVEDMLKNQTQYKKYVRMGQYKYRAHLTFSVKSIKKVRIPTKLCIELVNENLQCLYLYQHQAKPNQFELIIELIGYAQKTAFDNAILAFIYNIISDRQNLITVKQNIIVKNINTSTIVSKVILHTGYEQNHMLINYSMVQYKKNTRKRDNKLIDKNLSNSYNQFRVEQVGGENSSKVVVNQQNKALNFDALYYDCIGIFRNVLFFSQDKFIQELQRTTDKQKRVQIMRIIDHRSIVQRIWNETIDFVINRVPQSVKALFTTDQLAIMYNCNDIKIMTIFNQYVLSNEQVITQPHPVRGLLDQMPYLMTNTCFDLCYYNFSGYALNLVLTAQCLAKSFLTEDEFLRNDGASICLVGSPASGKSRVLNTISHFLNGFNFVDQGKGITEFQNYDIITKSFIKSEEVRLARLSQPGWKMLADIEISIKCRVKQQQDVEVTKNVPIIITSNDNVYDELLYKKSDSDHIKAACRRWTFIRYYQSWNQLHEQLVDNKTGKLIIEFDKIYNKHTINQELMNTLIACALCNSSRNYIITSYNVSYYAHCMIQFSKTVFGQIMFQYTTEVLNIIGKANEVYQNLPDQQCENVLCELQQQFDKIYDRHIMYLQHLSQNSQLLSQIEKITENSYPQYIKSVTLNNQQSFILAVQKNAPKSLVEFLNKHKHIKLYMDILQIVEEDQIACDEMTSVQEVQNIEEEELSLIEQDNSIDIDYYLKQE